MSTFQKFVAFSVMAIIAVLLGMFNAAYAKAQNDQIVVKHGETYIITNHGDLVNVNDDSVNVEGAMIKDNMTSAATITKVAKSVIPAMLPNTACGSQDGCIYDDSFRVDTFITSVTN